MKTENIHASHYDYMEQIPKKNLAHQMSLERIYVFICV